MLAPHILPKLFLLWLPSRLFPLWQEFLDAVGRLALMAFKYEEPTEVPPSLGFADSYQPAAKKLWLEDAQKAAYAELAFPDEVGDRAGLLGGRLNSH